MVGEYIKTNNNISISCTELGKKLINNNQNAEVRVFDGEQTNTSIFVGEDIVIKIYRNVSSGMHPEVEICRYMTEVAGFKNSPPYLGKVETIGADGETATLAILQGFVKNQGDCFSNAVKYLESCFDDSDVNHTAFLDRIRVLGIRTAEMHKAFAYGGNAAFEPELVTEKDVQLWVKRVKNQAVEAKLALENFAGDTPKQVKDLLSNWGKIISKIDDFTPTELNIVKTRCHCDYHLGQVIASDGDFYILDFEGEPIRSVKERREKQCQLKDVAGMARSFNYASWAALFAYAEKYKKPFNELLPFVEDWEKQAVDAYLESYQKAIKGCQSYPKDDMTARELFDMFVLERALYEIVGEIVNRPDWLRIPVQGVCQIIGIK